MVKLALARHSPCRYVCVARTHRDVGLCVGVQGGNDCDSVGVIPRAVDQIFASIEHAAEVRGRISCLHSLRVCRVGGNTSSSAACWRYIAMK
jgi:hypothetical protein